MNKIKNISANKGFTLVELIVTITILAILGTIAFISFQGYSKNSRDGVRVSDINSIQKSLELFITEKGFYPNPDIGTSITYKGALTWTQGTVGDTVIRNLGNISKKTIDPLTDTEYAYSVANNRIEYQIGSIVESSLIGYTKLPLITEQTYAIGLSKKATAKVVGTYNEKIIKVITGSVNYILAVPTIINANLNTTDLQNIITNKELVYNNYSNLPDSYKNLGYTMTGGFDFTPTNIEVYSGSTLSFSGITEKLTFMTNLKNAYSGTIIQGEDTYEDIININTDSNPNGALSLLNNYIVNNVGGITGKTSTITYRTCPLDGLTLAHGQTKTAYSESSLLYNASYECSDIAEERTCNDGTLSGDETHIYKNCAKGTPTNCSASGSYSYNGHTYSIPAINHSETSSGIVSTNVNENNGIFNYTLTNIECNDGAFINENESGANVVICNLNYSESGNSCIADTKIVSCTGKPTGSVYNTATDITQTWDGNNWLPSTSSTYNTDASTSECRYKCDTNYAWNGSACLEVINGVCGASNGQNLSVEPTTGLCASGNASSVSGTWPWNWTCDGINGGTSQNCNTTSYCSVLGIGIGCVIH